MRWNFYTLWINQNERKEPERGLERYVTVHVRIALQSSSFISG